jgi:glycosyltransferase involved in cell wall biosynthesis
MKVLHVLNHFLPYQTAGTEVYVWSLSKHLQKLGIEASVLIPNYGTLQNETYEYDGLIVTKYAEPSIPDRALITGQKNPEGLKYFVQCLQEQLPDIVHFHEIAGSNGITVAHFEAANSLGIKVVFTMHLASNTCKTGTLMYKRKELCDGVINKVKCSRCVLTAKTGNGLKTSLLLTASRILYTAGINSLLWQNALGTALSVPFQVKQLQDKLQRIANACDKLVPITEWYHKILLQNGVPAAKMQVVLQALPTKASTESIASKGINTPIRLIFIGRIDELKGVPLLINAISFFAAGQIELDIYGSSSNTSFVQQCKEASAAFTHIRWMGKVMQDEVVSTISKYDALILPSTFSEMSPLVIQEAFAAGVPVIGSNVYGIAEQIKHGVNGWLFQFNDVNALKQLLNYLLEYPDLLKQSKQRVQKPALFNELAFQYIKIYQDIKR